MTQNKGNKTANQSISQQIKTVFLLFIIIQGKNVRIKISHRPKMGKYC